MSRPTLAREAANRAAEEALSLLIQLRNSNEKRDREVPTQPSRELVDLIALTLQSVMTAQEKEWAQNRKARS